MYSAPLFRPDEAQLDSFNKNITGYIKNLLPYSLGYKSVPAFKSFIALPLKSKVLGSASFLKANDARTNYMFIGTTDGIYRFIPEGSLTHIELIKSGRLVGDEGNGLIKVWDDNVPETNIWEFIEFAGYIFALTEDRPLLYYDLNSTDAIVKFKKVEVNNNGQVGYIYGQTVSVWGDHLVVGGVTNERTGDRNLVRWSNLNKPLEWKLDKNSDADNQQFFSGGRVVNITRGKRPYIFMDNSIYRGIYIPSSNLLFQFSEVMNHIGLLARKSLVELEDVCYFYSDVGFCKIDINGNLSNIGDGAVNNYIRNRVSISNLRDMQGTLLFNNRYIGWSYKKNENLEARYDHILVYEPTLNIWSEIYFEHNNLIAAYSFGYTLEGLDRVSQHIEQLPYSLDSDVWVGGSLVNAGIDGKGNIGAFQDGYMPSEIDSGLLASEDGSLTEVTRIRLDCNNKAYLGNIMSSYYNDPYIDDLSNVKESGFAGVSNKIDWIYNRARSRYIRVRFTIPGSNTEYYINNYDIIMRRAGIL